MENFIMWLYNSFQVFIATIAESTMDIIDQSFLNYTRDYEDGLIYVDINLVLFSDTPILSTNLFDLLLMFFSVFYTVIFVVIVYKIIKKVLVKLTGWKKW